MAKSKAITLTPRQRAIVNHFSDFIRDEAARARFAEMVEAELRSMSPGFNDLHVTACAIRATKDCRK